MGWSPDHIRESQWKPPPHWTKQVQSLEQDQTAGGREYRRVNNSPGALARVVLRRQYRRVYAELRWQANKKAHRCYLGLVTESSRWANLQAGWRLARKDGLTPAEQSL